MKQKRNNGLPVPVRLVNWNSFATLLQKYTAMERVKATWLHGAWIADAVIDWWSIDCWVKSSIIWAVKIPPVALEGFDNADAVAMIRLPTPSITFRI